MFIAKYNGQIVLARDTQSELLQGLKLMNYDEISETSENYILHNGQYLTETEVLPEIKTQKQEENTRLAKLAVENGHVVFKNAEFETNAQTVGDLTATMLLMQASGIETYSWLSKDDQVVDLTLEDFGTLGALIAGYKNTIWQEKYIAYKTAIEQAETVEAVNAIDIDYTTDELTEQTEE